MQLSEVLLKYYKDTQWKHRKLIQYRWTSMAIFRHILTFPAGWLPHNRSHLLFVGQLDGWGRNLIHTVHLLHDLVVGFLHGGGHWVLVAGAVSVLVTRAVTVLAVSVAPLLVPSSAPLWLLRGRRGNLDVSVVLWWRHVHVHHLHVFFLGLDLVKCVCQNGRQGNLEHIIAVLLFHWLLLVLMMI